MQLVKTVRPLSVGEDDIIAWAMVRNFARTAASWLDHHRRLGVTRFILLDDQSDDGTREFLLDQPDCIVLQSERRFGDLEDGKHVRWRLKAEIIDAFLRGRWGILLDSDEYLVLPVGHESGIRALLAKADAHGVENIPAVMVDFHPGDPSLLFTPQPTRYNPFDDCNYFDRGPYVLWEPGAIIPNQVHGGIRETLLRREGLIRRHATNSADLDRSKKKNRIDETDQIGSLLHAPSTDLGLYNAVRKELNSGDYLRSAPWVFKTPVVKWTAGKAFGHDHHLKEAADGRLCLALVHFKLCRGFADHTAAAIEAKRHDQNSRAYIFYMRLTDRLKASETLIHRKSMRYTGPADLTAAQLTYDLL